MKLSEFISDVGRVVAYYPNLKKLTGSTTATILLCQFLYWTGKGSSEGWIYKTVDEIEDETGLTCYEQKTAKEALIVNGLLEQERRRLDHTSRYRVNIENLNSLWEKLMRLPARGEIPVPALPESPAQISVKDSPMVSLAEDPNSSPDKKGTDAVKKGDLVDGILAYSRSSGMKNMETKNAIADEIKTKFHINPVGKRWEEFINFAFSEQEKEGHPFSKFASWGLRNGFHPVFWTPEKMQVLYPQAFVDKKAEPEILEETFVEKDFSPMPKELSRRDK
jgi:hypothetical protein